MKKKKSREVSKGKLIKLVCLSFFILAEGQMETQSAPGFELPIVVAAGVQPAQGSIIAKSKNVSVHLSTPATAKNIHLTLHNLQRLRNDAPMAFFQVVNGNGESSQPIPLNNKNGVNDGLVYINDKVKSYGGIGGGFHTMTMTIGVKKLINIVTQGELSLTATNTFKFILHKEAYEEGVSAFRVTWMGVTDENYTSVLAGVPNSYAPGSSSDAPHLIAANSAANRSQGEKLWRGEITPLTAGPGKGTILAACMDCHTRTGYDLKYFGYSNESIYARSRFHGFTDDQAKQVTLYIRTLKDSNGATVPTYGRPWNPPYQPGKGLSDRPVNRWAAGGGSWKVLKADKDMIPHVFPDTNNNNKVDQDEVDNSFRLSQVNIGAPYLGINLIDIPIHLQLPDWNRWLPRVHPVDIWSDFKDITNGDPSPYAAYEDLSSTIDNGSIPFRWQLGRLHYQTVAFSAVGAHSSYTPWHYEPRDGTVITLAGNTNPMRSASYLNEGRLNEGTLALSSAPYRADMHDEYAKRALTHWQGVKYFEIYHVGGLEDEVATILGSGRTEAEKEELKKEKAWAANAPTVFNNAPHKTARNARYWEGRTNTYYPNATYYLDADDQSPVEGTYTSAVWYHLEAILNSGHKQKIGTAGTVDWAYNFSYIERLEDQSGQPQSMLYAATLMKNWQTRDITAESANATSNGWSLRTSTPGMAFSANSGMSDVLADLEEYSAGLYLYFNNTALRRWLEVVQHSSFPYRYSADLSNNKLDNWPRNANPSRHWSMLPEPDYKPTEWDGDYYLFNARNSADNFWRLLPILDQLGVDRPLLENLRDWCQSAWPGAAGNTNDWAGRLSDFGWFNTHVTVNRVHRFQNVRSPNLHLRSTGGAGTPLNASPVTDWRTRWYLQSAAGQWLYMKEDLPSSNRRIEVFSYDNKIRLSTSGKTGRELRWRPLSIGDGKVRFQVKAWSFDKQRLLIKFLGTSSNGVVRYQNYSDGDQSSWKLVYPYQN